VLTTKILGKTILEIEVRGKRGVGYCKSMPGAVRPFERLRSRLRPARIYGINRPEKLSVTMGTTGSYPKHYVKTLPCLRHSGIRNHLETLNPALKGE
jgi:hypothetical protein